ncbi:MAG: signal peptidase I [Candidatus Hydrogenedentes bacterium]|nr:signal peptidase I [Candidatus Hydrogenedentota bacterium]
MAAKGKQTKGESQGEALDFLVGFIKAFTGPWTWDNFKSWVKLIALVLTVWWLFVQPFRIPSGSMEPTLHGDPGFFVGDRVFVNKLIYGPRVPFTNIRIFKLGEPKRWDIVVFRSVEPESPNKVLIKRVVGLPGERVHIDHGKVYINGKALELPDSMPDVYYTLGPYLSQEELDQFLRSYPEQERGRAYEILDKQLPAYKYGIIPTDQYSLIPPGNYLMLGDNSERSQDGRFFGWVPHDHLLGRASCVWWPIKNRRDFTGFTKTWWGMLLIAGIPILLVAYELSRSFFMLPWRIKRTPLKALLRDGDHVWINRAAFGWRLPFSNSRVGKKLPKRGSVVAYTLPDSTRNDEQIEVAFGRLVALPGDAVKVEDGTVIVEGQRVGETGSAKSDAEWTTKKKSTVPDNQYLVLTDADTKLPDGRVFGWLPEDCLVGTVSIVWWPPQRARKVRDHGNAT